MSFLDRWFKHKEKKQLEAVKQPAEVYRGREKKVKAEAAVQAVADKQAVKKAVKISGVAQKVLVRPLVSEKATVAESLGQYTFVVHPDASKERIRLAVLEAYGVMPISVNIINVSGKRVRFGRTMGQRSDWKKAIVALPKGMSIRVHEGV